MRASFLVVAVLISAAIAASCTGSRACTPSNCLGCCTEAGVCAPGVSLQTCGIGGAMCSACSSSQTCTSGGACESAGGSGGSGGGQGMGTGGGTGGMGGGNVVVTETRMRVFLTSTEYTGSFGGVAGADQICALTAQAGNKGGTWKAWMSGTTENAIDRITDVGPWFQEKNDGTWVKTFNNNANLTTSLLSRLYVDEQGRGNSFDNTRFYWTGTLATGLHATTTCAGWTTSSASQSGLTGPGTSSWSNGSTDSCSASWAIVCFEQSKLPAPNTVSATKKRIFLTSTEFKGDFGGVTGADSLCNTAAQAATKGGQWKAWVSVTGMNAIDRISDVGPWYQEKNDSTLVLTFRNRANLVVSPLARLYVDEQGRGSAFDNTRYYWTGTQAGGAASSTTCTNWTSAGAGSSGLVGPGTSNWSAGSPDSCSASWALVCIEQ